MTKDALAALLRRAEQAERERDQYARVFRVLRAGLGLPADQADDGQDLLDAIDRGLRAERERDDALSRIATAREALVPALASLRQWEAASIAAHASNPNAVAQDSYEAASFAVFWRAAEKALPLVDEALRAP